MVDEVNEVEDVNANGQDATKDIKQILDEYANTLNSPTTTSEQLDNIVKELENMDVGFAYDDIAKLREIQNLANKKKEELTATVSSNNENMSQNTPNENMSQNTPNENNAEFVTVYLDGESKLETLRNDQDRREFVAKEFRNGSFTSKAHADFYIDQLAKGNIVLPNDPKDLQKIDSLLGGEIGITRLQEQIAKDVIDKLAISYKASTGVGNTTGSIQSVEATLKIDDLGLKDALKKYQKAEKKDDIEFVLREAKKVAIDCNYSGSENFAKYIEGLKDKKNGISKWRFRRRQRLDKAIRDIDPVAYWQEKRENSHWYGLKVYYAPRAFFAKRKSNKFDRVAKELEKTVDLSNKDASMKWLSKNILKKTWLKTQLLFRKSPEKMTEKLLKNANINKLNAFITRLDKKINLTANEKFADRLNVNAQEITINLLNTLKESCQNRAHSLETQKQQAISALGNDIIDNTGITLQSVTRNLEEQVAFLKQEYTKQLAKSPKIQIYIKLHGDELPKNGKINQEIITTGAVLQQISKAMGYPDIEAMLKAQGLKPQEIEAVKEKLMPKKEHKAEDNVADGQQSSGEENQPINEQVTSNVSNKENMGNPTEFNLSGYSKDEERNVYVNEQNQDMLLLNVADDKSRYDLITKDKKGQDREPTPDEIKAMVQQMAADGIKEVTLEQGFSKETEALFVAAFNEQKMAILNREEVEKRIAQETTKNKNKNKNENENENKSTENLKKGNIDVKKVFIGAINSSTTIEEQNKKIEMITKIQNGENLTQEEIRKTFGSDTMTANFFCNWVASKELEKEAGQDKELKKWVKEEKAKAGISEKTTSNVSIKISKVTELANKYKNKEDLENDPDYKKLPKYAQQGAKNLLIINTSELSENEKTTLRGQVLGHVIQGKKKRLPKKIGNNVINQQNLAQQQITQKDGR